MAEQSAPCDALEPASATAGGLGDGSNGIGDGNQPFAHPASKRDVPRVARVAHRIISAPGPPPVGQEVVDSRRSRSPNRRDAQASQSRTSLPPPTGKRVGTPCQTGAAVPIGHSLMAIWPEVGFPAPWPSCIWREGKRGSMRQPDGGVAHSSGGVTILARPHPAPAEPQSLLGAKAVVGNPRDRQSQVGVLNGGVGPPRWDGCVARMEARAFSGGLSAAPGFLGT